MKWLGSYEIGFHGLLRDCFKRHDDKARNVNSISIAAVYSTRNPLSVRSVLSVRLSVKRGRRESWDHAHEKELKQINCLCKFLANFLFLL
jgi:hypothetical protein